MSFYILKEPCILVFFEISLRCKTSCNALEITLEDFFNVNDQKMSPEYLELLKNAQELTTEQLKILNDIIKKF